MSILTTDDLVARVRRAASLPANAYTAQEILDVAAEVITSRILAAVLGEGYRLTTTDIALVKDQASYRVPSAALGGTLERVSWVDDESDERHMEPLTLEDLEARATAYSAQDVWGYVLIGDLITLIPEPDVSEGFLRLRYARSFPKLVPTDEAFRVATISGKQLNAGSDTVPAGWTTSNLFDVVQGDSNYDLLHARATATAVTTGAGGFVTLADDPDAAVAAGAWVSLAGESAVIGLPDPFHASVISYTAGKINFELGDRRGGGSAFDIGKSELASATKQTKPRVAGPPKVIVNRWGALRRGRRW